jgi:branched-chain amino acid transport system ATP-binding protein
VPVRSGEIYFENRKTSDVPPHVIVELGIVQIPEGRHVFGHLTVEENLLVGSYNRKDRRAIKNDMDIVYQYFPRLKGLHKILPGTFRVESSKCLQ